MADIGNLISDKGIERLERFIYFAQRAFKNRDISFDDSIEHEELSSPEVYIVRTPEEGIPSIFPDDIGTDAEPSSARCQVYKLAMRNGLMESVSISQTVYNIFPTDIEGNSWVIALRDKYGTYYAIDFSSGSSNGFPVELTSDFGGNGYEWKRLKLNSDGTFSDYPSHTVGDNAYTPDEDEDLGVGARGWLFPSSDVGTGSGSGSGSGTGTSDNLYVFIPVYKTRVYCDSNVLVNQRSFNGGDSWEDLESLGVSCGTGSGTSTSDDIIIGGCGWVAGLRDNNCLKLEVISANGYCETIDLEQILTLSWNGSEFESGLTTPGTFGSGTADDTFCYVGACGTVLFWIEAGYPRLTIDGVYLVWNRCGTVNGENFIEFTGGNTLCDPVGTEAESCEDNTFVVRLKCIACPTYYYCVATHGVCDGTGSHDVVETLLLTLSEAEDLGDLICAGPFESISEAYEVCPPECEIRLDLSITMSTTICDVKWTNKSIYNNTNIYTLEWTDGGGEPEGMGGSKGYGVRLTCNDDGTYNIGPICDILPGTAPYICYSGPPQTDNISPINISPDNFHLQLIYLHTDLACSESPITVTLDIYGQSP